MSTVAIIEKSEAYRNFIDSVDSEITKRNYKTFFIQFMKFCAKTTYEEMLVLAKEPEKLESKIRDYIIYLKQDRRLSPGSVAALLTPISHFYEMNGIDSIRWKRLKKFKGRMRTIVEDRPYTMDQIKKLLDAAILRDKCMILLMSSAGLRRGALPYLRIRDLTKIDKYNIHKIAVYKREQEQYITFCTPECSKYIDQYLEWRQRLGEQLKPNSPLLRASFDTVLEVNQPQSITSYIVNHMINKLLDNTGIRARRENDNSRTELMQSHGFRKFFHTECINHNMNPLYAEYLMGHKTGLIKSYFKPTDNELLEGNDQSLGYAAMIPYLTINVTEEENQKLKQELDKLKQHHSIEWESIREQITEMRQKMGLF